MVIPGGGRSLQVSTPINTSGEQHYDEVPATDRIIDSVPD
jgi:hypothetical protein